MTVTTKSDPAQSRQGSEEADDRVLLGAAVLFTVAVLVHGVDHLRRGVDATGADVVALGTSAVVLELGVVVLVCAPPAGAPRRLILVVTALQL